MLITGDDRLLEGSPRPPSHLHSPRPAEEDSVSRQLKLSTGLHVALIIFVVLKSLVFPGKPKVYQPALRVDLVGLPDLLKKDLSQVSPIPPGSSAPETPAQKDPAKEEAAQKVRPTEEASPEEMVLKASRPQDLSKRNRDRLKELERMARQEAERKRRMESALARMKSLAKITDDTSDQRPGVIIKGNQISRGASLSGDARENAEISYADLVKDRLQQNWELPVWLSRQQLSAKIEIFIDSRGGIRTFRFIKMSGNSQFDEAVKRTLAASQPFPAPPRDEAASLLVHGISVGFPL